MKLLEDLKKENAELKEKANESSNAPSSTPEQYLEVLSEEKDLNSLLHFC